MHLHVAPYQQCYVVGGLLHYYYVGTTNACWMWDHRDHDEASLTRNVDQAFEHVNLGFPEGVRDCRGMFRKGFPTARLL